MIQTRSDWIARSAVHLASRAVPGASIARVCGWSRVVEPFSSFVAAGDMIAIVTIVGNGSVAKSPDQPTYIESFAQAIRRELANFGDSGKAHILFSAHSIPERYVREGDPYLEQTKKTVELIMDRLDRRIPAAGGP